MPNAESFKDEPWNNPNRDDDWFIRNAIYCWLYHFGEEHQWHDKYSELAKRDTYLPKPRRAKRRKTPNAVTELLS